MLNLPATFRLILAAVLLLYARAYGASAPRDGDYDREIEADWARQEARMGRIPGERSATEAAVSRCRSLLERLQAENPNLSLDAESGEMRRLEQKFAGFAAMNDSDRQTLYLDARRLARGIALSGSGIGGQPIVFMKRRRFICQMLHEYMGYFCDYGGVEGGGVFRLEKPGRSMAIRNLIADRLPRGNFVTLSLSYDATNVYFAFAPRAEKKPDYYSSDRRCFHIYACDPDGGNFRQLTDGQEDDFDPCPLPDGGIAFMSSRRGGFIRCSNPWEPIPAYTLHRMDADGGNVSILSVHETNEWHPSVLNDGRIVYTRWDYVDRSAAHFHGIWATNPDGTDPTALFGNYTQNINACYQPRAIPGSRRIVFVAGAHHADVGGSLVLLDPARASLDPASGQDDFSSLEVLTPEVCFAEAPGWPKSYFHSPWPLNETFFLVAFSFDPLPGMGPKVEKDTMTGIYLFDRFGGLELLYRDPDFSSMYPIPLAARSRPPVLIAPSDPGLGDEGEFILADVNRGLYPMPEGRAIREIRVFQILPKSETHIANQPRIGHANAESGRMFLGAAPVESDGSASFRVPARKPLYFQAVDAEGKAVQGMRSATYLQPGERRGCVGCHEQRGTAPASLPTIAARRAPSRLTPGPDGSAPWSYPRLVQTVLDRHCVRCHDGSKDGRPVLTGKRDGEFTASYNSLKPYAAWYEWGSGIEGFVTRPGRMPADMSRLAGILDAPHHREAFKLTDDEQRRIYLWLDGNAAFYGTFEKEARLAQLRGEIAPPQKQQ
ncbi:MAG TPA: hypothetical protein PL033_11420 [Candidatus Brocadiia bacterium]|nr:hypothetical protein [Candidatus Brocadiia bacterium]